MIYKNAEIYNIVDMIQHKEDGFLLSRIPQNVRLSLNELAQTMAFNGCGVEIRFVLKGEYAKVILTREKIEHAPYFGIVEIFFGSFQAAQIDNPIYLADKPVEITIRKPDNLENLITLYEKEKLLYHPEIIRILLPYDAPTRIIDINGDLEPPPKINEKSILFYGSSITHGGNAISNSNTYAGKLSELLNMQLINLGFAGSAHMEQEMADYIASRQDWDIAVLEMGINVFGKWDIDKYKERVDNFVSRIAEKKKDKWIFCIDMFKSAADYFDHEKANQFRTALKEIINRKQLPKLVYLSGYDLLKTSRELSSDLVHPSQYGMDQIAKRLHISIINIIKAHK